MNHTTGNQDSDISAAETHGQEADTHVSNLVAIIQDLDDKVTAWQEAAGTDDPRSLARLLSERESHIDELESQLEEAERNGGEHA